MPTVEAADLAADQMGMRQIRQMNQNIFSSKDDMFSDHQVNGMGKAEKDFALRKGRLLFALWQSFVTGTTITSWVITSSIYTSSLPAGALACLPTSSTACPAPAGK